MQGLPQEVVELIFNSFESDALSIKACVSLTCTCQALRAVFEGSSRQACCKKAALKRLLRWNHTDEHRGCHYARLDQQQTVRLIKWLENEVITVEDFWEAQAPLTSALEGQQHADTLDLQLTLLEKFPRGRVLTAKARKSLEFHMAQFGAFVKPWYARVCVLHDPGNGERREQLYVYSRFHSRFHYNICKCLNS